MTTGGAPGLRWARREPSLEPAAATAPPGRTAALARATCDRLALGSPLRAAASAGRLVVLGSADELPWCDGVLYLGWDGGLLAPTALAPTLPIGLLADAVRRRVPPGHGLVVLLPDAVLAAPLPARPTTPGQLADLVEPEPAAGAM